MKILKHFVLILLFFFFYNGIAQEKNTNETSMPDNAVWKTYKHRDASVQLPDYFSYGLLTNSEIQYFDTDRFDNFMAAIEVYEGNEKELSYSFKRSQEHMGTVTYKLFKKNWFVVSSNQSGTIHYQKCVLKGKQIHVLMIDYPENLKEFESLIPRISKSFQ